MKSIKSHFEIHSRFRNGILLLVVLIFLFLLALYYYPGSVNSSNDFKELGRFQTQIDSLKKEAIKKKESYRLRPFNPNFISDYKGYTLGMSTEELDRLYAYRKDNKWINSVSQFKIITKVSDSLLAVISPLFKFPDWVKNSKNSKSYQKSKYPVKSFTQKEDLNKVTSAELQEKIGVPNFIAERIIKHRNKLSGFISDLQLKDVIGLYENQRDKILALYTVKTKKDIERININEASVKELMEVPYFDFETALDIKDFIEENNGISSFEELGKIEGFSLEKIDRIALYLILN
ncbi:helix-hairpin-helix domain-containing protein [Aquimarina sp. BL5]|uniref:ComEA family DNA-binding protein n=1 Tax=Aquimarina sp. BL5 TaxID=1714860 RepID=UPI000E546404|nr:helix-hairpin-helix domain-containing protein [Aquimarina sp. BL5]AXT50863.1 helix-hairpin-helix domain-containing protein [Aquimarina sp. BL5]RKN05127.1 helix-hairpin-helix domain-containing protein [Aquimarina sp. BL5]